MTLLLVAHALVASAIAALVAGFADRAARLWGRPARFVWAGAMAASLLLTPGAVALAILAPRSELVAPILVGPAAPGVRAGVTGLATRLAAAPAAHAAELVVLALWAVASLAVLIAAVRAMRGVARASTSWEPHTIEGEPVLLSGSIGPAVVGLRRPRIVLPRWVLELDQPLRSLIVLHEREHVRSRDPWLLGAGLAAVVLEPWNLALWWMLARLRLAVEIDCDGRVLRARPGVRRYGQLLIAVGQRTAVTLLPLAPTLVEDPIPLARRIDAMTAARPRHHALRAVSLAAVAGGLAAAACALPAPTNARVEGASASVAPASPATTRGVAGPDKPFFEFRIDKPAVWDARSPGPRYPDSLRTAKVEGEVVARFVVDTTGAVLPGSLRILRSTHEMFADAVREAMPRMRFVPAEVKGRKVRQLLEQPFTFAMAR